MQSQNPNATPQDLLYNLIEASSYSPEIGRNLPQLYAELNKAREVAATKNVNFGGNQPGIQPGGISSPSQQPNPIVEEATRKSLNFPTNRGPQEAPGNLPQEATSGQVRPVLSGDQLLTKAQQRQQEWARNGINKPLNEVFEQVSLENQQNQLYNTQIENERQNRIKAQETYGALAEQKLTNKIPDASDQEKAIFREIGEKAAGQGKSEGQIGQYIIREVDKYKNSLSNIQKNLEAPRIQNKLQRLALGKGADFKSVEQDARAAIQPLLDLGMYDKSRTMLSNAGFYPEEREKIIFGDIPQDLKKTIDSISQASFEKRPTPKVSGIPGIPGGNYAAPKEYNLKSKVDLYSNLSKVWGGKENDNINLLLLRKAYEDKGYDWRIFKDSLNDLVNSGHIKLNDDQQDIFNSYLNNPPLNKIESILHGLGLRGR